MTAPRKKIWIFAGEASGDTYGARLAAGIRELERRAGNEIDIAGMGGEKMKAAGVDILVDSSELGVMGVIEVLKIIFTIIKVFFFLKNQALKERPDAVVLIDYPGFNLRFAKAMHRHGIPVIWYVSPHVWTWGRRRIHQLDRYCEKMLVIFPFEKDVYSRVRLETEFVGHPLVDIMRERRDPDIIRDPNLLLLLPGSRAMEINRLLLPMLETAMEMKKRHPYLNFVISAPREKVFRLCESIYNKFRRSHPDAPEIELSCGRTAYWQQQAGTGLAASGTVTVECAIAGLPLVVVYKLNWFTLLAAAALVKLYRGFFTMVNIIADKEVFEEFLQWQVTAGKLADALERILPGGKRRTEVETEMRQMAAAISGSGLTAGDQAAKACVGFLYRKP
ncbi:MAG: lipid-A-disaccharide synthase [Victivallaceae bacterium]|nr:lipid-A-disaccharide synthase [Victivallaceae bacterium]